MRPIYTVIALAFAGLATPSAVAQSSDPGQVVVAPLVSMWGTGEGMGIYHNLFADCENIVHAHGRNAAWGSWSMPRSAVDVEVLATQSGTELVFRCLDNTACIVERVNGERSLTEHRVAVGVQARADRFVQELGDIGAGCASAASPKSASLQGPSSYEGDERVRVSKILALRSKSGHLGRL